MTRADGTREAAGEAAPRLCVLLLGARAATLAPLLAARGHRTEICASLEAAATVLRTVEPELVMLGWGEAGLPADTLLARLWEAGPRGAAQGAAPHVLALTEGGDADGRLAGTRDAALHAGADAVLETPAAAGALDAVLASLSRRAVAARDTRRRQARMLSRLDALQTRFDGLDGDLMEARKLQQGLLGNRSVDLGPTRISTILRPASHVGGDLVGHFPINGEAFGFYALDVSGHGISSALMTARLAGYLPATSPRQNVAVVPDGAGGWAPRSPEDTITELNELVMEDLATDHYFTLLLGHVFPATGQVVLAQAGHPHPALQSIDGAVRFVGEGGLPVGLIPGAYYENTTLTLARGERLFVHSDGFTDAVLSDGSYFGDDRLVALLEKFRPLEGTAFLEALIWELGQVLGEEGFYEDDVSALVIERS